MSDKQRTATSIFVAVSLIVFFVAGFIAGAGHVLTKSQMWLENNNHSIMIAVDGHVFEHFVD